MLKVISTLSMNVKSSGTSELLGKWGGTSDSKLGGGHKKTFSQ